jgi:uncharacterized protein YidB (DUF937 family)
VTRLATLLDDPAVRELIYGLGHVGPGKSGAARLCAVVLRLVETAHPEQYRSWLSDDASNEPMTVDQVWLAIDGPVIEDLARFTGGSPGAVAWQLAGVLPDVVDAISPGGNIIDAARLTREIEEAITFDDRSAGAFGG